MIDNKEHFLWVERHAPQNLDNYVGNETLIQNAKIWIESGEIPNLLLFGKSGVGKTLLSKVLVKNIDCDFMYVNASDKRGIDFLRDDIIPFANSVGFKDRKVVILDEADYLTNIGAQPALRHVLESSSRTTRFILTCNYVEKIIDPIKSRCDVYHIIPPSRKEVAVLLTKILDKENIEYDISDLAVIVNSTYPDMRRAINLIQRQSINGKLKISKQSIIESNYMLKIVEKFKHIEDGKELFKSIRKIISDSKVRDFQDLYRFLYDNIDEFSNGHVALSILIIAEHQFRDISCVDKEINAMSMMVNLIKEIKKG
ncbi:MAG: AAA family ATPase [Bacteroidetes bacterium]|nr:AAA family ATPase [Bacteroidota bacterium]